MMKRVAPILASMLLAACGGNVRTTEIAQYDLGNLTGSWSETRIPIAALDVQAASWLSGPAMYFRLAYAEPLRRQSYAESRWAAPPAELLEAFLKRRMVFDPPDVDGSGCRLHVFLDELEQRFDDPQKSQQVLEVRALLRPLHGAETLSRRAFPIRQPAATATARGGAAATRDAAQALAADFGGWLEEIAREKPGIAKRCGSR